ncbi:MAG: D-mannonate epimerase, partial [Clostridium sp.]|nr:D-mannonate epimerase [Clostridium sp.]
FSSTWVGNKSVYRTRMMIADGGELLVIAPGLRRFGENAEVDGLIRRYGYRGTPRTMELVEQGAFVGADMVSAHMIHSSSEGRFSITYAVDPENMTREEIEGVGYRYMELSKALERYPVEQLSEGAQVMPDGEEIYLVKAPALGLWRSRY